MRPSLPSQPPPLPLLKIVSPRTAIRIPVPTSSRPDVSIVIPARNEESNLGACLESLTTQAGVAFEIIVVDDDSTDRTREIAQKFAGVRVISPEPLSEGRTGKNNALVAGAREAGARWLLFTDADTVHLPGSLARALAEAQKEGADLLSYSPDQIVVTFSERAVMPVIFAELAAEYPPHKVREQSAGVVANGQYILVRRAAYDAVGGHAAVAKEILEDVALARLFREAGRRVYFRYGGDAVRTRMYRSWEQLREGWTKNLVLLFPRPWWLASWITTWWMLSWTMLVLGVASIAAGYWRTAYYLLPAIFLYRRSSTANFAILNNLLAIAFGPPAFAYLLLCSRNAHLNGQVSWKGRSYNVGGPSKNAPDEKQTARPIPLDNLRIGN